MSLSTARALNKHALCALLLSVASAMTRAQRAPQVWVGTWAASQQLPETQNLLPIEGGREFTLRQIFHLSVGGEMLRVRVSNAFGVEPLKFKSVHIARPLSAASAAIDPASDKTLNFSGNAEVTVPPGAEYLSDPVAYPVAALSSLTVSVCLEKASTQQTGHPGSRATSYYADGDVVSAANLPDAKQVDHWFHVSGIDVMEPDHAGAIVVLGDSITDGHGTTTNGNDRWTDVLASRLQASPNLRSVGVLNQGVGGNHLLTDGLGPSALARLDRDALAQVGVRWLIVLEGVNDLGGLARTSEATAEEHRLLVHRIEQAYEQIVARAHANGIRVIGGTITPFVGSDYYHPGAANEADRQAVNQWILAAGHFDAVIDFDKVVRDPHQPERLQPSYDGGDHLHPSVPGYRAMGEAVPLSLFAN
jgi:lysophospholipase L1-like esterase